MPYPIIFAICLVIPFLLIRSILYIIGEPVSDIHPYTREGLKFHHFHYGMAVVIIASLVIVFTEKSLANIGMLGFGLGMVLDEFIASMMIPETEPTDTRIYRQSFRATAVLLLIVLSVMALMAWASV